MNHNTFLLIPTYVTDHKDIDDPTAILFGRLNALSNQYGYCFESDEYLSGISKCQRRVVTKRISLLKELGFIRVITVKKGLKWDRKIYTCNHYEAIDNTDIKISSTEEFKKQFTCLYNLSAEDEMLSFQAKGLLWYMLSRPNNWKINRKHLSTIYKGDRKDNGLDAINRMFQELIEREYVVYTKQDPQSKKLIHRYDVYPVPLNTFYPGSAE